jgi:hypothetical protein
LGRVAARYLPLDEIVMVIDAHMPVHAKPIQFIIIPHGSVDEHEFQLLQLPAVEARLSF